MIIRGNVMNILFFSQAAWDDKNSFGNTISNFFCGDAWKDDKFASFYVRKQMPDNKANVSYYNLSAIDIVKGIFKFNIKGCIFSTENIYVEKEKLNSAHNIEKKNIDKLHQKKSKLVYFCHELIWRSRLWLNRDLKKFITDNAPDILFAFATSPYILWPLIQYMKKKTNCKVVLLIADDVYGYYEKEVFYRRRYLKKNLEKCILASDRLYGISDEMCELYKSRFGKDVSTLYKGCDLSIEPKQHLNHPLKFVYAGNLLWGRDETLSAVADVLEKLNQNGIKARLEIYTASTITEQMKRKLNRGNTSEIRGVKPYEEIKQIMHEADIVLHVESFEKKEIETVRYSFSTKIIDCMQSGTQVLGIGPKGIASIEYLKKVEGVIVIDDKTKIESTVQNISQNENKIIKNALYTRQYALKHHDINDVQKKLREDLEKIL